MMKLLHAADLHLGAPLGGFPEDQRRILRQALDAVPDTLTRLCKTHDCDLLLLAGDVFDGEPGADTLNRFREAMAEAEIPVLISPGNHDYFETNSLWNRAIWPENVHIFTTSTPESLALPELDCRVWGAAFRSMDCPPLLPGFRAEGSETHRIGLFHGDPTQVTSPYNPITAQQVRASGLSYLALGHIHKGDSFRAGGTLCAWPGCPMGRGYDETGPKGVLLVTLDETVTTEFLPLDTPRFFDLETGEDALDALLPAAGSEDFYRITLTGYAPALDLTALQAKYARCPNLILRDRTVRETALWDCVEDDTLEGGIFRKLREAQAPEDTVLLAARITRQLLDGQEVTLP